MEAVTWFPFGPDGGDARAFAGDPQDPAHVYLGAANGWIYQSHDGGKKWERLAQIGKRDDLIVRHIVVDPANSKHIVVGAYVIADGGGIYVSNDSGMTWTNEPAMQGQSVRALTAAPSNPKILVAGTLDGVFRSMDGGASWARISPKDSTEIHEVESLAVDPKDPDVIYAGTWHLAWKTSDGGKSWKNIKQGIIDDSDVFSIILDPKQPSTVYLSACSGIYKSDDAGGKFTKVQGIPSTARRTRVLMEDPDNLSTVFAGTTEGLYRTFDAGKFWMQTTSADVIVNDVYVDPSNAKHVLLATDRRGVMASEDGGDSFAPSNTGFSARLITAFTGDSQHAAVVYVGVVNDKDQGGVFMSRTGGLSWSHLSDGLDGHDVFSMTQAPDGTILAGTEHGIYRLRDSTWSRAGNNATSGAAGQNEATKGWVVARTGKAAGRPAPRSLGAVAVRPLKDFDGSVYGFARVGDSLYAATSGGLLLSPSSGATWSLLSGLPTQEWRYIAASEQAVAVASLTAIQMSQDGGKTWKAAALPASLKQVTALSVDGRGEIWVADRDGAFVSADKGVDWLPVKDLNVRNVNSLYFDAQSNRMLVTTSGPSTTAFAVAIPSMQVKSWDTGWNLRFLRPVGDHLIAATLFDGIVVQPRWVDSSELAKH